MNSTNRKKFMHFHLVVGVLGASILLPYYMAGAEVKQRTSVGESPLTLVDRTGASAMSPASPQDKGIRNDSLSWQVPARLDRFLGGDSGTLVIDGQGVEFKPDKGSPQRWAFVEIRSLDLWPQRLVLKDYEKRGRLRPGSRQYRFDLKETMPPAIAAELVRRAGRPMRNGNPDRKAASFAEIPARHRTGFGGTASNGILKFRDEGIDYVTESKRESRSWRWADIRTLSNPEVYRLLLFGYLETYSFDLKQPLTRELFDRISDEVYTHNVEAWRSGGREGQ